MAHLLQVLLFHIGQQRAKRLVVLPTRPQGQSLDEKSHGSFDARNLCRAARSDHAKDHIAAAVVDAAKHNGPQGLHQGRESYGLCRCQLLQAGSQALVQLKLQGLRLGKFRFCRISPGCRACRLALRQGNARQAAKIMQQVGPIGARRPFIKLRPPAAVDLKGKGLGQAQTTRGGIGTDLGQGKKLAQQHAHAPAVHQQMVEAPAHDRAAIAPPEKPGPQQRPARHVKTALPLCQQQGLHFCLGLCLWQMRKIVIFQACAWLAQHNAVEFALHRHGEQRTQALVPRGEQFPAAHERKNIHPALKVKFHLLGVHARLRQQRLVQQGLVAAVGLGDALHIFRLATAGVKNGVQRLLRQIGWQGFEGLKPAGEQPVNPGLRQAGGAIPRPKVQCALLVKVGRYLQRRFGLHLAVHQFGYQPRREGREHQRGLVVWLACHAAKIVEGNLARVVECLGIIPPQITVGIAALWRKMLGQPRPHGLACVSAGAGGL